jgi:predicted alpha-1,2-mannosidase
MIAARKSLMQKKLGIILIGLAVTSSALGQAARYIDPMLGVDGGGNTFPGPSLPFGMIKPGPDIGDNKGNAGWKAKGDINGFSQTHLNGAGGGPKYGNILIQPTTGITRAGGYASPRSDEQASVGYYRVRLARYQTNVEITTAGRAAIYRFTYPATEAKNILFDVSHMLSSTNDYGEAQTVVGSSVHVLSPTEIAGRTTLVGGWNKQTTPYTVYFYASTDTAATSWGTWNGDVFHEGSKQQEGGVWVGSGAWLTFAASERPVVQCKVGISFVSEAQAKRNVATEIPSFDFEKVHLQAIAVWEKALSTLEIKGASEQDLQVFYTAIYHTMLTPVDRTGENPVWKSDEPYYDDFFTLWDTFRSSGPLLTLIAPDRQAQMVRTLIDVYRHEGWLPDGRSGNFNGRTQGGSNAEFVIVDAYLKGLPGIDWETAYQGMIKDAEVSPPDQTREGRGGLDDWKNLGYLSIEGVDRPASKQMEYAADDFEIALLASALNHPEDHAKYLKRSQNWQGLWDEQAADGGFTGFIWSRHRDGTWKAPFHALEGCTWGGDTFYEGNAWTYSTFVPQDAARLIERSGGNQTFVRRLDAFFAVPGRYDVTNEPGFLSPYLYIWAGRQDRTADQIRAILANSFRAGRQGLPGNDDSGAMSSWYAFGKMGFYPNAGQDVYLIGSPAFPEVSIRLGNGKTFVIEAKNVTVENKYIARAEWNGQPYTKAWFRNEDIMRGGRLVLTMSAQPAAWSTGDLPPSSSAKMQ